MADYMTRIGQICTPGASDSFNGFFVLQDTVQVFSYFGVGAHRRPEQVDEYSIFDAGNPWTSDLADIAFNTGTSSRLVDLRLTYVVFKRIKTALFFLYLCPFTMIATISSKI